MNCLSSEYFICFLQLGHIFIREFISIHLLIIPSLKNSFDINNNIMYGINNLSTNSFTVLRDKTFLLMSAFGEGFVLINMETKKGEMILTKKKLF